MSQLNAVFGINGDELRRLVSNVAGLSANEVLNDIICLNLDDAQWDNLKSVSEAVEYQGFNPRKMIAEIASRLERFNNHQMKEITVNNSTFSYTDEPTTLDVSFMLTIFLTRGNFIPKILSTITPELSAIISRKCANLGIATATPRAGFKMTPTTVTLSRLAQGFPQIAAALIMKYNIEGTITPKWIPSTQLLQLLQHSIFPSLIPHSCSITANLITISVALNIEFTILFKTPRERKKFEQMEIGELAELSHKFVNAAVEGTICTTEVQIRILKNAGIVDSQQRLTNMIALLETCDRFLSNKTTSYKDTVINMTRQPRSSSA